jgi:hypothetical protein
MRKGVPEEGKKVLREGVGGRAKLDLMTYGLGCMKRKNSDQQS